MKYFSYKLIKFTYLDVFLLSILFIGFIDESSHSKIGSAIIYLSILIGYIGTLFKNSELYDKTADAIFNSFQELEDQDSKKIRHLSYIAAIALLIIGLYLKYV
ncbi:hypothetical protein [Aquirhabdus parva]|uniref:Uncharacterized protein n=1 Tax=Aquirhabdus parva TaxID=2283318 RepID=A0A345P7L0_9GAMM|nr:hypothetical protein [Aquirhabdus parva]AXI03269.1 hypothetical protein HYN46_10715 [Aquirhabdus parva]